MNKDKELEKDFRFRNTQKQVDAFKQQILEVLKAQESELNAVANEAADNTAHNARVAGQTDEAAEAAGQSQVKKAEELLNEVKDKKPNIFTKSGLMLGLGEEKNEIMQVMDDLRAAKVDFLTLGQYLQPTKKHAPVIKYVSPDEFESYKIIAESKGFLMVSSSPLTRSSHHAEEDFKILKQKRIKKIS